MYPDNQSSDHCQSLTDAPSTLDSMLRALQMLSPDVPKPPVGVVVSKLLPKKRNLREKLSGLSRAPQLLCGGALNVDLLAFTPAPTVPSRCPHAG